MKTMMRNAAVLAAGMAALAGPAAAQRQLKVVTSTTDLADLASEVCGNRCQVVHISEGFQDPHFVEAKPSFILQLRNADVFAFVGLDLEIGWMPLLVQGARNPKIQQGGTGYLDVSTAIRVLDRPTGNVDRSQGDVHPAGNPHYWLDPENGRRIARLFRDRFSRLSPADAATFARNYAAWEARLNAAERGWAPQIAQIRGKPVVAWHTSWRYFAEYTGMNIVGFMEPKPGVPPSPSHLYQVIQKVKSSGAKAIIMEPFYDRKVADLVAKQTGIKVL
ncbi:metal ABC transporter substrate-binding protein, partial [Longimicrobium sp.]|uniref:metal ABC transporter substrate-binding protein n=1 Tax=Longimicrobium sp. TaxID=2029185 RepID=UPI002C40B083